MDARQLHTIAYSVQMNRIDRGLSIEELAEESGLSAEVIAAIEAETYAPSGVEVNAIADAMGLPNWCFMV